MDISTGFFILVGLLLMFSPLDLITKLMYGSKTTTNYYSLIVPVFGAVLFVIGLLAYHKKNLQYLFLRACQDVEQTGFGRGIGNAAIEAFRPLLTLGENGGSGELKAISSLG